MSNEFLILAIAEIFEIPELSIQQDVEWWEEELAELLSRVEVQKRLKDWIASEHWKRKRGWYGGNEKE